jgi:hypothetical protein
MSCCGKKRRALHPAVLQQNVPDEVHKGMATNTDIANPTGAVSAVFRYSGKRSLYIRSDSNKRGYYFSEHNPEQMVSPEDISLVRGYSELVEKK